MDPNDISNFMSKVFENNVMTSTLKWTGYIMVGLLIVFIFYLLYLFMAYRYKIYYYELKDLDTSKLRKGTSFNIDQRKPKRDWARPIKEKGVSKWRLLLCRKTIRPVEYKNIGPQNKIWMIRSGPGTFIPSVRNTNFVVGDHIITDLLPVPDDIDYWYSIESREAIANFQKDGYQKQIMLIAAGVIIAMLIFSALTIWFNLQAAQGTVEKIDIVAGAINSLKSVGPG